MLDKFLKSLFHHEWVQAVKQIVQRGCEITFLTDRKNLAGPRHEQGILTQGILSGVWTEYSPRSPLETKILFGSKCLHSLFLGLNKSSIPSPP